MDTKQVITEIKIGESSLQLFLQEKVPLVEVNGQIYAFFLHLIQAIPLLADHSYLEAYARISNFYWKANRFCFIDSIEEYQDFYTKRIQFEKNNPLDLFEYRLTDYKIFDVSVMHGPKIQQNELIYFTYNRSNYIPYKVISPFPYHLNQPIHYQILPIIVLEHCQD